VDDPLSRSRGDGRLGGGAAASEVALLAAPLSTRGAVLPRMRGSIVTASSA